MPKPVWMYRRFLYYACLSTFSMFALSMDLCHKLQEGDQTSLDYPRFLYYTCLSILHMFALSMELGTVYGPLSQITGRIDHSLLMTNLF